MLADLLKLMERLGRLGAALGLVLAVASALGGGWLLATMGPWNGESVWSPWLTGAGFALLTQAAMLFVFAGRQAFRPARRRFTALPVPELLDRATRLTPPFYACVRCRLIFFPTECVGQCLSCDSKADCLEISSAEDVRLLRAALG